MDTTFLTYREFADKEDHEKQDNARKTVSTNEKIHDVPSAI